LHGHRLSAAPRCARAIGGRGQAPQALPARRRRREDRPMSASLLNVDNARKAFGGLVAVNDVSFDVKDGELIGLIGPNGSGKTTMLNLISGALRPSAGQITLAGETISGEPAHRIARRGVARTFQLVRVLPSLSVEENVIAGA